VYVDDDQPVVALDTGMDRVIEVEFVSRPGVRSLDLASDLATFLVEGGIFATVDTFDHNEIDYDANLDAVSVGNGILDAAELALVEAVLKNTATDFSARGGRY